MTGAPHPTVIGYYVHHHGSGHAQRFATVAERLPGCVGLGSGPRPGSIPADRWVELPLDTDPEGPSPLDPTAGGSLHWAPLRTAGLTERTAAIVRWVETARPSAIVVDVSVEVALLARLLSVPTVVVVQHGDRSDPPHVLAYRTAAAVAALWHEGSADPLVGAEGRMHHVGPISRFDGRLTGLGAAGSVDQADRPTVDAPRPVDRRRRALLLLGRGGLDLTEREVEHAMEASATDWTWEIVGAFPQLGGRDASADELWTALLRADVVIAPASNNCVAEVAAARRPLIAVPQRRPFGEQDAHGRALERLGLATVLDSWPAAASWPGLLDAACSRGERWDTHHDGLGGERLCEVIERVAAT